MRRVPAVPSAEMSGGQVPSSRGLPHSGTVPSSDMPGNGREVQGHGGGQWPGSPVYGTAGLWVRDLVDSALT